ncbi:MAG TPA: hypothetical protein VME86_16260 [Acidobacteriaceae bacterium]|jgi:hypothetical protein|nr:hypothetical protein [Acidobacteriaceae bacterium]
MKNLIRASVLSIAVAGLVAGFMPNHNAKAQQAALSHQVVSSIMPNPACGPNSCDIRSTSGN